MNAISERIVAEVPLPNGDTLIVARCHPDSFRFEIYPDYQTERLVLRYKILNQSTKKELTHVEMWKHFDLDDVYSDRNYKTIGKVWRRSGKQITGYYPILKEHGVDTDVDNLFLLLRLA